jgi:hypothetical protein
MKTPAALLLLLLLASPALADPPATGSPTTWVSGTISGTMLAAPEAPFCAIASIRNDARRSVEVDWACVEESARAYVASDPRRRPEMVPAMAHVLKAVRDGTAAAVRAPIK